MDDITIDDNLGSQNIGLTASMKANLAEAFKWMRTVSIIQFIFLGLGALVMFTAFANVPRGFGGIMFVVLIILAAIFILWITLFKAAQTFKSFTISGNNTDLETAFLKQKQFWLASGIITIIFASIYGILFLLALANGGRGIF